MKICFTIFAVILAFHASSGQHLEPQRGDNLILIKVSSNQDSTYTAIGHALVTSGFALITDSREFKQFTTNPKILNQSFDIRYAVVVTIDGDWIKIAPMIHLQNTVENNPGVYKWYYKKSKYSTNSVVLSDIQKTFGPFGALHFNKI
jgi:hypothetical protein